MSLSKGCKPFCLASSIPAGSEECQREKERKGWMEASAVMVLRFLTAGDGEVLESKVA